jgi:hypothetical protein
MTIMLLRIKSLIITGINKKKIEEAIKFLQEHGYIVYEENRST